MKALRLMTYVELIGAKAKIDIAIRKRDAKERRQLEKTIIAMRLLGKSSNKATSTRGHALKGRKLKPKYRNPLDRGQTWAGRGLQPKWVSAALKRGKKLSSLLIK
jgi:DNA-binding protein H-NS